MNMKIVPSEDIMLLSNMPPLLINLEGNRTIFQHSHVTPTFKKRILNERTKISIKVQDDVLLRIYLTSKIVNNK